MKVVQSSSYCFTAKLWRDEGPGGWFFITIPRDISSNIKKLHYRDGEEGWGRLKCRVLILKTEWKTSIWYDSKTDGFLLPIKSLVRKREGLCEGDDVLVTIGLS